MGIEKTPFTHLEYEFASITNNKAKKTVNDSKYTRATCVPIK